MKHDPTVRIAALLEHSGWLRGLARHLVADPADADDVVQLTYLAALERPGGSRVAGRAWLAGVARNVALQLGRSESRRTRRERATARAEATPSADHVSEVVETQQRLSRAVLELDEPFRSTVFLRYYENLAPAEIAARLGVPAATVRGRLKRALERLRGRLDREHDGDRAAWGAALLPLTAATRGEVLGGTAASALSGALAMGLYLKLFVGAALLAGVSFVLWPEPAAPAASTGEALAVANEPAALPVPESTPHAADALERGAREPVADAGPLQPTAAVGEVVADTCCIVGRVLDPDGIPVTGARLEAVDGRPRDPRILVVLEEERPELVTTSDAEGHFRLVVPAERALLVRATHADFAPGFVRDAFAGEQRDVTLARGSRLRVAVTASADGRALEGAGVSVRSLEGYGSPQAWSLQGQTDADGVVELERVPPGKFTVYATKEGFSERGARPGQAEDEVLVEVELRLPAEAVVTGVVHDALTEQPLAGAEVGDSAGASTRTDARGRFRLGGLTAAGNVSHPVVASAPGYAPEVVYVQLNEVGSERDIVLRLSPAARVSGRVLDSLGSPVAGATVVFRGRFSTNPFTAEVHKGETRTDGYGRFALDVQPTGEYGLAAQAPGYAAVHASFGPSAASEGADLGDLVLSAVGSISGDVRGREPEARADLVLLRAGEVRVASAMVNAAGRFRLEQVPTGSFELTLHAWDGKDERHSEAVLARRSVSLAEGQALTEIALVLARPIRGVVRGPDGERARGARVALFEQGRESVEVASTWTDGRGAFALLAEGPGSYRLVAADPGLSFDPVELEGVAPGRQGLDLRLAQRDTGLAIAGRLTDSSGAAIDGVYVHFEHATSGLAVARVAIPDEQGWWSMKNLDDVAYDLSIVDFEDRYLPAGRDGVRPGGEPVELELELRP
jgi:RNA polymerase sigma-70 factor (ECF subfamily)